MKNCMMKGMAIAIASFVALGANNAYAQKTVRIQDYPGLGNFLVRVANANGLCEKNGIKCEIRVLPSSPLGMQTLMSGDLDVAFAASETVIQIANKGADLKILGSGAREPVFFLMAAAGMSLPNLAKGYPAVMHDFKGKKIGITARGSGNEFQLKDMLAGAGMTIEDITMVAVGAPNTAFPAIANKQIDAMLSFNPMDGFCEVTKACTVVVDPRKGQGPSAILKVAGAAMLLVTRGDYATKNPDALEAYGKAMREAETFAQNPANAVAVLKIAQDSFKVTIPDGDRAVEIALKNSLPGYRFPVDAKALQHVSEYNFRNGQIDKVVDTSKLLQSR